MLEYTEFSDDGVNDYLQSILQPEEYPNALIPSTDMTHHVPKDVLLSERLKGFDSLVFVTFPGSVFEPVLQGRKVVSPITGTDVIGWEAVIETDDPIYVDFQSARLVSHKLSIYSDTRSTSNAVLSGVISASRFLTQPPFHSLDPDRLSAYNTPDTVLNIPVNDGLTAIFLPLDKMEMRSHGPNALPFDKGEFALVELPYDANAAANAVRATYPAPFNNPLNVGPLQGFALSWSNATDPDFPSGYRGNLLLDYQFTFRYTGTSATGPKRWWILVEHINETGALEINNLIDIGTYWSVSDNANGMVNLGGQALVASQFPIARISLTSIAPGLGGFNGAVVSATFRVTSTHHGNQTIDRPVYVMSVANIDADQSIIVNGFFNYEAVPSISLQRNINAAPDMRDTMDDLEMAMRAVAFAPVIRPFYATPVYESLYPVFHDICHRNTLVRARAAGWRDVGRLLSGAGKRAYGFLKRTKKYWKPIADDFLPAPVSGLLDKGFAMSKEPRRRAYGEEAMAAGSFDLDVGGYRTGIKRAYAMGRGKSPRPSIVSDSEQDDPPAVGISLELKDDQEPEEEGVDSTFGWVKDLIEEDGSVKQGTITLNSTQYAGVFAGKEAELEEVLGDLWSVTRTRKGGYRITAPMDFLLLTISNHTGFAADLSLAEKIKLKARKKKPELSFSVEPEPVDLWEENVQEEEDEDEKDQVEEEPAKPARKKRMKKEKITKKALKAIFEKVPLITPASRRLNMGNPPTLEEEYLDDYVFVTESEVFGLRTFVQNGSFKGPDGVYYQQFPLVDKDGKYIGLGKLVLSTGPVEDHEYDKYTKADDSGIKRKMGIDVAIKGSALSSVIFFMSRNTPQVNCFITFIPPEGVMEVEGTSLGLASFLLFNLYPNGLVSTGGMTDDLTPDYPMYVEAKVKGAVADVENSFNMVIVMAENASLPVFTPDPPTSYDLDPYSITTYMDLIVMYTSWHFKAYVPPARDPVEEREFALDEELLQDFFQLYFEISETDPTGVNLLDPILPHLTPYLDDNLELTKEAVYIPSKYFNLFEQAEKRLAKLREIKSYDLDYVITADDALRTGGEFPDGITVKEALDLVEQDEGDDLPAAKKAGYVGIRKRVKAVLASARKTKTIKTDDLKRLVQAVNILDSERNPGKKSKSKTASVKSKYADMKLTTRKRENPTIKRLKGA